MREFKDGMYETWEDYHLGEQMVEGDRVSCLQYVKSNIAFFTKNKIRYRMMRIRKWAHQYLRIYIHKEDLETLRRIIDANTKRYLPRGIACIAGRL